jgi:hypothetical protein
MLTTDSVAQTFSPDSILTDLLLTRVECHDISTQGSTFTFQLHSMPRVVWNRGDGEFVHESDWYKHYKTFLRRATHTLGKSWTLSAPAISETKVSPKRTGCWVGMGLNNSSVFCNQIKQGYQCSCVACIWLQTWHNLRVFEVIKPRLQVSCSRLLPLRNSSLRLYIPN